MDLFIPSRLVVTSAIIALLFSHFVSSHDSAAATQNEPTQQIPGMPVIIHDPVECVIENKHPLFQASVQAQGGPHTVKIYFHAQNYDDFYYVEMAEAGDVWQASLPIAAPETRGFLYYIEVVDLSFNTSRTAEFTTKVTGENACDRRDEGAPPIVVGSTTAGATPVPGGFLTTGISRVIASSGAAQAVGGGIGGGIGAITGVIIAAGAAGAGLAILGGGSDEPEPEPEAPPTVDPPPGEGGGGGGGGGGGPDADLAVNVSGPATATVGTIVFGVTVTNNGPLDALNAVLNFNCNAPITDVPPGFSSCSGKGTPSVTCGPNTLSPGSVPLNFDVTPSAPISLTCSASVSSATVDNSPGNNSNIASVTVVPQRSPDVIPVELETAFTSRLDVPPPNGSVRGQVLLNGTQLDQTDNSAPFRHHLKGQKGKNTVDARVVSGTGEGRWVFNLSRAPHFVGGSLVVESGQVISRGSGRVIFRVGPSSGPIKFRFRLSP